MGCQTVGKTLNLDTDLKISFMVEKDVNLDDAGKASPVYIRIYELKSENAFSGAGFIDIFEQDKEVLGADFIAVRRLNAPLAPGETRNEHYVLGQDTRFVGIYAEFLDFKGATYKAVIPINSHNIMKDKAVIKLSKNTLQVVK